MEISTDIVDTTSTTTDRLSCFDFLSLPTELKRRTAYFLATRDVIHLGQTCQSVQHALVLRQLQPSRQLINVPIIAPDNNLAPDDEGTLRRVVPRIPIWNRRVHSVRLTMQYQSTARALQAAAGAAGGGQQLDLLPIYNPSCYVYVTAHAAAAADAATVRLSCNETEHRSALGRVVASLPAFRGTPGITTWSTQWAPLEGEIYYIWYAPAIVRIVSMELQTRILDDFDSVVSRQYTKLARLGVLCHHTPDATTNGASNATHTTTLATSSTTTDHRHNNNTNNHHLASAPTLFFYPQLLLHVAQSLRTTATAGYALVQFWQQQAGLSLEPRDLAALEEILQADLEERQWRLLEQIAAAQAVRAMDEEAAMH